MAKKEKVRLDCRALPYLEPVPPTEVLGDLAAGFLGGRWISPARAAVEARSDLTFLDEVVSALRHEGIADPMAEGAALRLLGAPTLAARTSPKDRRTPIVQSLVLQRTPDDFDIQLTARLHAVPGKPGRLVVEGVETKVVDMDDGDDACGLVADVERLWGEYPMPAAVAPKPYPLRPWAWLGDPTHVGLLETPPGWREVLRAAGAVYGVQPLVVDSADKVATWTVEDRIDHAVVVRGTKWAASFPSDAAPRDIEVVALGGYGATFAGIVGELRALLLAEARAADAPPKPSRDLEKSEVVYHRKVGESQKFDHFDAGSSEPCKHGAEAFGPWGGDKATKGMARLYDNFNADMLIHCSRYPKCGMYGVDAARGGHKADKDDT